MDSRALGRVALVIVALGVIVALSWLWLRATPEESGVGRSQAVEAARQRHAMEQERAARERERLAAEAAAREREAREREARARQAAAPGDDDQDQEPELGPDGLPDRGPPFDPYNVVLTGDRGYDMQTRRSAASRLYTQGDFPAAIAMARQVLSEDPDDVRAQLLVVRAACAMGDADLAREFHARLPEADRHRAGTPCREAGIEFAEPKPPDPARAQ